MIGISDYYIMYISNLLSNYRLSVYLYDQSPSMSRKRNYLEESLKIKDTMKSIGIDMATINNILSTFGGSHYASSECKGQPDDYIVDLFSKDKVSERMEYLIKSEMSEYLIEEENNMPDNMTKDDIIYLNCTLALMMASMEAYNLNPEEEFFYDCGISMQNVFIKKMKELGVGEAIVGAIITECGGCYGYKDDGSEEDEEIIEFFMPDKIKERLERR